MVINGKNILQQDCLVYLDKFQCEIGADQIKLLVKKKKGHEQFQVGK